MLIANEVKFVNITVGSPNASTVKEVQDVFIMNLSITVSRVVVKVYVSIARDETIVETVDLRSITRKRKSKSYPPKFSIQKMN